RRPRRRSTKPADRPMSIEPKESKPSSEQPPEQVVALEPEPPQLQPADGPGEDDLQSKPRRRGRRGGRRRSAAKAEATTSE
ncbi:MAG TPA: hypothetical protein VK781_05020, partial [Solirubrobacteraceae bacterium]|nr:hypothetical protein [Solirubrobacteraceae bacterium]